MNIEDAMVEDVHGIIGSEPRPVDYTEQTRYIREVYRKLQADLYQQRRARKRGGEWEVPVQYLDEIHQLRAWWMEGFAHHNHRGLDLYPCNFNDILSHLYIQLCYVQFHRQQSKILEFERRWLATSQGKYDFSLIVDACCALASLAGCKHAYIMQDPELQRVSATASNIAHPLTLGQLELNQKLAELDRIESQKHQVDSSKDLDQVSLPSFPTLEQLDVLAYEHHLGFINLWFYYRYHRNSENQLYEWEVHNQLVDYIRSLQVQYLAQIEGQRERQRQLSLQRTEEKREEERKEDSDDEDGEGDGMELPKEWLPPSDRWKKERALHTYMMKEEQPQNSGCYYWFRTPLSYIDRLLVLQTHVFAQVEAEYALLNQYPQYTFNRWQRNYAHSYKALVGWIKTLSSKSSENEDGLVKVFKSVTFEHILPLGARSISTRMKDSRKQPDIVFRDMMGDRATMYIDDLVTNHKSRAHIAKTPTHPLYPFLLLTILHFSLKQQGQALNDFVKECVVPSSRVLGTEIKVFDKQRQYGRTRVPLMIILTGKYCIHSYFDQDSHELQEQEEEGEEEGGGVRFGDGLGIGTGYWYVCNNAMEWVLTWFVLCYMQYPNSLEFPIGRSFKHWLQVFRLV
jgi:hypothetical protein